MLGQSKTIIIKVERMPELVQGNGNMPEALKPL